MSRPRLTVTQTQRLQLTPSLQTAIHLLCADAAGLTRYLEEQAEGNPHLRLDPAPLPTPGEWLPRWSGVIGGSPMPDLAEAPAASLMAHVMGAMGRMGFSARQGRMADALAEALEPSGWLGKSLDAIARDLGVAVAELEPVIARLQRIEPVGLFARNLVECLRLQLIEQGLLDDVTRVILTRLDLLAAADLARLAQLAHTTPAEIAARFRIIRSLDPKPGAQFAPLAVAAAREPDLLVRRTAAGGWEVSLNRSCLPTLSVVTDGIPRAADQLLAAKAAVRLLASRNDTPLRVGREVLLRQRAALDHGAGALVAMTMADVAAAVGLHESTVSRIVAGSAVDTPRGTWWLRRLFSARVGEQGAASSGAAVQARLAQLVAGERKDAPLSDAALALALAEGGVAVARRTVAKYRAALGIAPAHRRRSKAGAESGRRDARRGAEKPNAGA